MSFCLFRFSHFMLKNHIYFVDYRLPTDRINIKKTLTPMSTSMLYCPDAEIGSFATFDRNLNCTRSHRDSILATRTNQPTEQFPVRYCVRRCYCVWPIPSLATSLQPAISIHDHVHRPRWKCPVCSTFSFFVIWTMPWLSSVELPLRPQMKSESSESSSSYSVSWSL